MFEGLIFINKMEECNAIFGQQQIENIYTTLNMIIENTQNNDELIQYNVQKCVMWCSKYNVLYNQMFV